MRTSADKLPESVYVTAALIDIAGRSSALDRFDPREELVVLLNTELPRILHSRNTNKPQYSVPTNLQSYLKSFELPVSVRQRYSFCQSKRSSGRW